NYMPHRIYGQHVAYMFQTPTTRVWHALHEQGKLTAEQDIFWNVKPPDELYDLAGDRDEVHNLANSAEHREILEKLRRAQRDLAEQIRDVGFLPEGELHERCEGSTPYRLGHDPRKYPFERIFATAELASTLKPEAVPALVKAFEDSESAVRYWAVLGLLMRGKPAVEVGHGSLVSLLADPSPYVRIAAAEALARYGEPGDWALALKVLGDHAYWNRGNVFVAMSALNSLDELGADGRVETLKTKLRDARKGFVPHARYSEYVPRLL